MRSFKNIALVAMAALLSWSASAQSFGGLLIDRDGMMSSDMYELSQVNFGFGTARSMAMAGAFTSLGGDVSAMALNPAGLGMYRTNDFSITPMMSFQKANNSAANWGDNSRSRFSMGSMGLVLNLFEEGGSGMVSLNFGFGYNRIADLNYRYGFHSASAPSTSPLRSITDVFSLQMGGSGIYPSTPGGPLNYDFSQAYFWGGILAYNGWLLDAEGSGADRYWTNANRIGINAGVGHTIGVESRGSIGEYDISMGMNFDNKIYVGATLGLQVVDWKRGFYYSEDYLYNGQMPIAGYDESGEPIILTEAAQWMDYDQMVNISGTGVNFKVGIIYRPIPALRFGMAIHTPTFYSLERDYQAFMGTNFSQPKNGNNGDLTPVLSDMGENAWDFTSPTRLMFGASYTIAKMAIVSIDYERTWYNGIRMKDVPNGFDIYPADYRAQMKENYKGANTLRAGVELKPVPFISLRAGYGLSAGMLRHNKNEYTSRPQNYRTEAITAGVGFSFGRTTLDFAYQNIQNKLTSYYLYWATDALGDLNTESPRYTTNFSRNYAVVTLGYRF